MPKVSIIIPAYNSLTYLPTAINSVFRQTFQDFELVIIDDGSSDKTADWVSCLTESQIKLISQDNQGASTARNIGIANSEGEYIAFLDADDLWRPSKLTKQVERLDNLPQVGLVHCWTEFTNAQGDKTGKVMTSYGEGTVWKEMVLYNLLRCGSTPMIRRTCFESLGVFDTALKYAEDWDMWIRIASQYEFSIINEPLVFYREHEDNKSKNYEGQLESFCKIIDKAIDSRSENLRSLQRRAYGRAHLHAAWRALVLAEDYHRSSDLLKQALNYSPKLHLSTHCIHLKLQLARRQSAILGWPIELILSARQMMPNIKALSRQETVLGK